MNRSHSKKNLNTPEKSGLVNIANLKAHLAKYLRIVQTGKEVIVTDHKRPVARIVPLNVKGSLESTPPQVDFQSLLRKMNIGPLSVKPTVDSLSLLLEERGTR